MGGLYACMLSRFKSVRLCILVDGSPTGSSVPGILQARIPVWVANSFSKACMHAKSLQSCLTVCNLIDGSPTGSSVPGILQARIPVWVAISFSKACMHAKSLQSCLTVCSRIDSSPPGFSVHRILQARILEWVATVPVYWGQAWPYDWLRPMKT